MKQNLSIQRWLLILSCLSTLMVGGCQRANDPTRGVPRGQDSGDSASGAQRPMRVTPISPGRKTLVRTVDLPGRTEAFEVTPLYANVTGYVSKVLADIGDRVVGPKDGELGAVLCEVVVPELQEQLAEKSAVIGQVKAGVTQAEAGIKLAEASVASARAHVAEAQAASEGEQAQYARWQSEYDRVQRLASTGAITQKVAEETKAELSAAQAARQQSAAKIASAEALVTESAAGLEKARADVAAQAALLTVALAEERRLSALMTYTQIRAPYDGVIVDRRVHTGHLVRASGDRQEGALLTIMRVDPMRVIVDIPESDAVYINDQTKIELRVPALPLQTYAGTITRTGWSLDNASRTLKAEVDLPNADGQWRPGMYLQVKLTVAEHVDAVAIPKTAIFTQEKQTYCYCLNAQDHLERRPITLGMQAGNEFEVISGLEGTERIIGSNAGAFREGQHVEVVVPKT